MAAELISVNSTSSWLFVEGCQQMQPPFCLLRLKSKRLFLWILGVENACVLHAASGDAGDRTPDFSHAKRTLYHWVTSPTNVTAVTVETLLQLTFIPSQSITNVFPHINYIYYTYTRYMHYSSIMIFFPLINHNIILFILPAVSNVNSSLVIRPLFGWQSSDSEDQRTIECWVVRRMLIGQLKGA